MGSLSMFCEDKTRKHLPIHLEDGYDCSLFGGPHIDENVSPASDGRDQGTDELVHVQNVLNVDVASAVAR